MNEKNNILDAWIMLEHLSEGDINTSSMDKNIMSSKDICDENFYTLFMEEIKKSKKLTERSGIIIYFNIFWFNNIVVILREKYKLAFTDEEITRGKKFSFALYFNKELMLNREMTFLTACYYIRKYKEIPKGTDFSLFEREYKNKLGELFECNEDEKYEDCFNNAISSILREENIKVENCVARIVQNLDTDATNLHSFFIDDLVNAKRIQSNILDDYILGKHKDPRVDLDSRAKSSRFNPNTFRDILQPKNYPISRFPNNPSFALSFMQQVAVNLAIGFDNEQIRSVNGPPGTGKTTLLKDIFAEMIVQQAHEIVELPEKCIQGIRKGNSTIGIMPLKIAKKGIIVASSNNAAIQNIVSEISLLTAIDKEFSESIIKADYFRQIANSITKSIVDDFGEQQETLNSAINDKKTELWGMFSIEGGRKENNNNIIKAIESMAKYLDEEYVPDANVYQNFKKQYNEVHEYRNKMQKMSETVDKICLLHKDIDNARRKYLEEEKSNNILVTEKNATILEDIAIVQKKVNTLAELQQEENTQLLRVLEDKEKTTQLIDALKLQKPSFFSFGKRKREYKSKINDYSDRLQKSINDEYLLKNKISSTEIELKKMHEEITRKQVEMKQNREVFDRLIQKRKEKIKGLEKEVKLLRETIGGKNIKGIDFTVDYDALQMSNPWFGIDYRRLQSNLFITALKVRKQFLYENKENVKEAKIVWDEQKEHTGLDAVIPAAWDWINMAIPVISSTFASFSRMFANIGKEQLGYLFVDEAGQALPQASVGAIFRSRNVLIVGDPSQIKPVVSLESNILGMLAKYYDVNQKYLSDSASTQKLADETSKYGFYKDDSKKEWIGIPLWVHRRCKNPMFDISNKISYGGNMTIWKKADGVSEWLDVGGQANDKYVKEQGEALKNKIIEMSLKNKDILDKEKKDIVYVITPFKNVAKELAMKLNEEDIRFTRYDNNGKPTNIGTVHTFQGKEASIVFLVLGADCNSKGAAEWAMGTKNTNIMNVAVTRAKDEFYIIGDKKLYLGLKSSVIDDAFTIINEFNAKHKE